MQVNFYTTIITNNGVAECLADELFLAPLHCVLEVFQGEDPVKRYEVTLLSSFVRVVPIENAAAPTQNTALKALRFVLLLLKFAVSMILVVPFTIIGTILKSYTQGNEENRMKCAKLQTWLDPTLRRMFQEVQDNADRRALEDKNDKLLKNMKPSDTELTAPAHMQQKKDPMTIALSFLKAKELPVAALVCKRWRDLTLHQSIWKNLARAYHVPIPGGGTRSEVTQWMQQFGRNHVKSTKEIFGGYENILSLPISPSIPNAFPIIFSGITIPNSFFPLQKAVYRGEYISGEATLLFSNIYQYAIIRVMCTYLSTDAAEDDHVLIDDQRRCPGVVIFDGQRTALYLYHDAYHGSKPDHFEYLQSQHFSSDHDVNWYQDLLSGKTCPGDRVPRHNNQQVCTYQLWTEQFHNEWTTWANQHGRDRCKTFYT